MRYKDRWDKGDYRSLARYETIKKFVILPRDLLQEEGEITPTLKLKRKVVLGKYGHLLESLYDDDRSN